MPIISSRCLHIYMFIYMCIYIYIYMICIYNKYVYIYIYIYIYMCVHTHTKDLATLGVKANKVCLRIYFCVYVSICMFVYLFVCLCICLYVYVCICMFMYAYIQTRRSKNDEHYIGTSDGHLHMYLYTQCSMTRSIVDVTDFNVV